MSDPFISFHNHTSSGSLLDALISTEQLLGRAKELGQSAIAVTDHGSVFSIYDAFKISKQNGVKLIPGNEFYFVHDPDDEEERGNKHLVLIARNETGWRNILKLNYLAWQKQKTIFMKQYPRITWKDIEQYNEGIIALTACSSGIIARHIMHNDMDKAHCHVEKLKGIFGDNLFLEVQPHSLKTENGKVDQVRVNETMFQLCKEYDLKPIATCDAHYLDANDAVYHDMLLAIKDKKPISDPDRHRYSVNEFYLKPGRAIMEFFGSARGAELIRNSQLINSRCENPTYLEPKGAKLPQFPVSDAADYSEFKTWKEENIKGELPEDAAYLRYKTIRGFQQLYNHLEPEKIDEYWQRLKTEIKILEEKSFSSYMLIVADYIDWAKKNEIMVGPARGSAAGSLVANVIGITTPDPIKHKLLFARFINKYKKAYPDIDVDFSMPDKVKDYLKKKYGEKRVASISNVAVMSPKVVVKDVARSLELGGKADDSDEVKKSETFRIANNITKVMPDVAETVQQAMGISREFAAFMAKYPELYKHCTRLQNIERQYGVHAAGVVIVNDDLDEIAPLRCDRDGNLVLAWEKERAEENGFIKFDLLGLITLCVIADTIKTIKRTTGSDIDIEKIPLEDQEVFKNIARGSTKCVFQLEASLTPLCRAIKPTSIDDIAVITALGRPAVPQEQRKAYIERRFGKADIELLHPNMANCTKDTYGELIFEEQLMELAHDIAGWELDKADNLRKITKMKEKGKELVAKTEGEFIGDAIKNGIDKFSAQNIWDVIAGWSGYGFNRSHAVAYSYLSYYTAWLKHYYPTEFMCAIINSEDPNSDKVQEYKQAAIEMGIEIAPPSISTSGLKYEVVGPHRIVTGLLAVKGIGDGAIEYIIDHRPYQSFPEFIMKSTGTKGNRSPITKTVIESLAKVGCFDGLGMTRKNALEHWSDVKTKVAAAVKRAAKNSTEVDLSRVMEELDPEDEYPKRQVMKNEMEVIGHYLTGNHNDIYGGFFRNTPDITSLADVGKTSSGQTVKIEAVIKVKIKELKINKKSSKSFGRAFAKYMLEDVNGVTAELTLWPDHYEKLRTIFTDGTAIRALCEVNEYMDTKSLVLRQVEDIPDVFAKGRMIKK